MPKSDISQRMLLWLVGGGNEGYEFDELVIREAVKIEKSVKFVHTLDFDSPPGV